MLYRHRKTGKIVTATFRPAYTHGTAVQANDLYSYYSVRDGKRFGPVQTMRVERFNELYVQVQA